MQMKYKCFSKFTREVTIYSVIFGAVISSLTPHVHGETVDRGDLTQYRWRGRYTVSAPRPLTL